MVASENATSSLVREMLSCDFGRRYVSQRDHPFYAGGRYINQVEDICLELAKKVFDAKVAHVQPTGGLLADMAVILAATEGEEGNFIATSPKNGGFPFRVQFHPFPFNNEEMNVDPRRAANYIKEIKPKLVFFGSSNFLFPQPVKELAEVSKSVGATVAYDGSHVLGLIAGRKFQNPFNEGADVLVGSTHKTFPGPQGGIILAKNDDETFHKIVKSCHTFVGNSHSNRMAALAIALAEMLEFGESYATQVIKNAKALGAALHREGIDVLCSQKDYTESHQVIMKLEPGRGLQVKDQLEAANIIADTDGRLGTLEVTRLGMKEQEMKQIANLIASCIRGTEKSVKIAEGVKELVRQFSTVNFSFEVESDAYAYWELAKLG